MSHAEHLWPFFADLDREGFAVLGIDSRQRVVAKELLTLGNDFHTIVDPRMVYRWALVQGRTCGGCRSVVVAHNHPSGDPTPSEQDRAVTRRLKSAGDAIGIRLLDHLIFVPDGQSFSFREAGFLPHDRWPYATVPDYDPTVN